MRSNHRTDFETFKALDGLPPPLFREICFASRVYDAIELSDLYKQAVRDRGKAFAIAWLTKSIRGMDDQDLLSFAWKFQTRYKMPLPHLAANASILRFMPSAGTKVYRVPRGAEPRVKRAFQSSERLLPKVVA